MSHGWTLSLLIVFWTACGLVAYTYVGYPLLLFVASSAAELRRVWRRLLGNGAEAAAEAPANAEALPGVSIVVAAHNEERELPELIACLARLEYPRERLELIVVSDGSTDGTDAYLASLQQPWIRVHRQSRQQGKAAALNAGVELARHPVLLLSDASTRPQPESLRKLAAHFTDPGVGVVCGGLRFAHNGETRQTEGVYWSYECLLRIMEGRLGATLTASGAFYAVRKACFPQLSSTSWIEDFLVPLHARQAGYRVVYEPEAWAWEFPAPSVGGEFRRRVRLAIGSFRALSTLLRARVDAATRWALISHKLLRWSVPFLMLAAFGANLALLPLPAYRWLLLAQLLGYGAACAAGSGLKPLRRSRLAQGLYFFLAMNAAFLWGCVLFLRDRGDTAWHQVR
ncbi:MAG: glycosyltransferase family 2 protein [Terriglobales bacterium]